ncbi:MAG: hypothetical protein KDI03_19555 [Anaerolineae bacterium]|nr:hypothetical protein [Anaerolineae bacterium]
MWFLGLGFAVPAIGAFRNAYRAEFPGGGCFVGFILVLFAVMWFALGTFFFFIKPFPLPLGTSKLFCANWGSADVDGVIRINPSRYSIGDSGRLSFQFRNTSSDTVTSGDIDISLGSLSPEFPGEVGISLGPFNVTSKPVLQVEITQLPTSVRPNSGFLPSGDLVTDGTILKPNEAFSVEIPVIAVNVGNEQLGNYTPLRGYTGVHMKTEVRVGADKCANLSFGSLDLVSVVP